MSQDEVIDWLEANPGWHRTSEVADGVRRDRENNQRASESLRRAWKANQIKREMRKDRRAWWSA